MGILSKFYKWITKSDEVTSVDPRFNIRSNYGSRYGGTIDSYGHRRKPTADDLLYELKNTAFACASKNAATCAAYPPQLYVRNAPGMPEPKCDTRTLSKREQYWIKKGTPWLQGLVAPKEEIAAVTDHPMMDLIAKANPLMCGQELLEYTTLYQEIVGVCYWLLTFDPVGRPEEIWIMPAQRVFPRQGETNPQDFRTVYNINHYDWMVQGITHTQTIRVPPQFVIDFKYPNPRDPYRGYLSPLEAMMESVNVNSEFLASQQALWENRARPDAIISPRDYMGEDERARLEEEFNQKFRRGGAGKILVAETRMNVTPLAFNVNEIALLAQHGTTKEDICNGFDVPLAFLTKDTNMANLQASMQLYMQHGIQPRLHRRDQKLTESLCSIYDPTGRLFCSSEDPVPEDVAAKREQERIDLEHGVATINEVRAARGEKPVPWGDYPWLPNWFLPADDDNPDERIAQIQGGKKPGGKANLFARGNS